MIFLLKFSLKEPWMWYMVFGIIAFMSLITFFVYVDDKRKAIKGKWRTKEAVLLLLSLFYGSYGGIAAMILVRHKINKPYFIIVNLIGFLYNTGVIVFGVLILLNIIHL